MGRAVDWHSRIVGYVGAATGIGAVLVSLVAICQSDEAVEWQRGTRIQTEAEFRADSVVIGRLKKVTLGAGRRVFEGIFLPSLLKITNGSQHPITIDTIVDRCLLWGSEIELDDDGWRLLGVERPSQPFAYPLIVHPGEQERIPFLARWLASGPSNSRIGESLKDTTVSVDEIMTLLFKGRLSDDVVPEALPAALLLDTLPTSEDTSYTGTFAGSECGVILDIYIAADTIHTFVYYMPDLEVKSNLRETVCRMEVNHIPSFVSESREMRFRGVFNKP
ncbi:MAG: hypothetical protein ABIE70_05165 [bacterium]